MSSDTFDHSRGAARIDPTGEPTPEPNVAEQEGNPGIVPQWDQSAADPLGPDLAQPSGEVLPGWEKVPESAYAAGLSGGWGGPGAHLTGPIPKIRPPRSTADQA